MTLILLTNKGLQLKFIHILQSGDE